MILNLSSGNNLNKTAQASIETTLALICLFVLLLGSFRLYIGLTRRIVARDQEYEDRRVASGSSYTSAEIDDNMPKDREIHIFSQ